MNKITKVIIAAAVLSVAAYANAAQKSYNSGDKAFSIDIPSGWTEKAVEGGVQLISPDSKTSLAIVVADSGGLDSKTLADSIAKEANYENPQIECEDVYCNIYGTINGVKVGTTVSADAESKLFMTITQAGEDADSLKKIIDSIE
ncbi:MAG: hypothetical protein J5934_00375 [Succinivibrio sp.]|nr:hypothetical protein [Succinivibrio sp.]